MSVVFGDERVTISDPDFREVMRQKTAIEELAHDAQMVKSLSGGKKTRLRMRKTEGGDEYFEVTAGPLAISFGQYKDDARAQTLPLFPGGYKRLFNISSDLSPDTDAAPFKSDAVDMAKEVHRRLVEGQYSGDVRRYVETEIYPKTIRDKWPKEARMDLYDLIQRAFNAVAA